jgi:uncharacterized membrane protein
MGMRANHITLADSIIVYDILMSQEFVDWYENTFMDHVTGEEKCKTREEILADIEQLIKDKSP